VYTQENKRKKKKKAIEVRARQRAQQRPFPPSLCDWVALSNSNINSSTAGLQQRDEREREKKVEFFVIYLHSAASLRCCSPSPSLCVALPPFRIRRRLRKAAAVPDRTRGKNIELVTQGERGRGIVR
jgi:hypothetical protein